MSQQARTLPTLDLAGPRLVPRRALSPEGFRTRNGGLRSADAVPSHLLAAPQMVAEFNRLWCQPSGGVILFKAEEPAKPTHGGVITARTGAHGVVKRRNWST